MDIKRNQIDDVYKRNQSKDSYRSRQLGDKKSTSDEYTGERIFDQHPCHGGDKTINIDHVTPIKRIKDRYGNDVVNGNLTLDDLRDVANQDYNLAATSESLNKSKNSKTNIEYLWDKAKSGDPESLITTVNMTKQQIISEVSISATLNYRKMNNAFDKYAKGSVLEGWGNRLNTLSPSIEKGVNAGLNATTSTLIVSSVNLLVHTARGDISPRDAAQKLVVIGGTTLVSKTAEEVIYDQIMKRTGTQILKNEIASAVNLVAMAEPVQRMLKGDIDKNQCIIEMVMNGVSTLALTAGYALGNIAGTAVVSLVLGAVQNSVLNYYQSYVQEQRMNAEKERAFKSLIREMQVALESQNRRLDQIQEEQHLAYVALLQQGLKDMLESAFRQDAQGINEGLNRILSYFNDECHFQSVEEFDTFFYDDTAKFVL